MLGAAGIRSDIRQVDVGLLAGRQLYLRLFRRLFQALQRQRVAVEIDTLVLLEFVAEKIDDAQVKILPAQKGIAIGGQHLELVLAIHLGYFNYGNVEGAAAEIIHGQPGISLFLVHAVGQGCSRRFINYAPHLKSRDLARVLGCLAL